MISTAIANAQQDNSNTKSPEKKVTPQSQTLTCAEDIKDKKVIFIFMVAAPVTPAKVHFRPNQSHSSTYTQSDKMSVNLTAGIVVRIIDKKERERAVTSARPCTVT